MLSQPFGYYYLCKYININQSITILLLILKSNQTDILFLAQLQFLLPEFQTKTL